MHRISAIDWDSAMIWSTYSPTSYEKNSTTLHNTTDDRTDSLDVTTSLIGTIYAHESWKILSVSDHALGPRTCPIAPRDHWLCPVHIARVRSAIGFSTHLTFSTNVFELYGCTLSWYRFTEDFLHKLLKKSVHTTSASDTRISCSQFSFQSLITFRRQKDDE